MNWEIYDGRTTFGPVPEDQVLAAIQRGELGPATMVRPAGKEAWKSLRIHAPFAMALDHGPPKAGSAKGFPLSGWIAIGVGVAAAAGAISFAVVGSTPRKAAPTATPEPPAHTAPLTKAPEPPKKSNLEILYEETSVEKAFAMTRENMTDKFNTTSIGALAFALWTAKHLKIDDVKEPKNETSYAAVMKDTEAERGRRMCLGNEGRVIQIETDRSAGPPIYSGLLSGGDGNLYHFITTGSTEGIVQHTMKRFCGIVTGRYDYKNSGGGTGHAVEIVGFFDLPENHRKKM